MNTAPIVSKVWSCCITLCDDGVSFLEQLIFLKMADEYATPPTSACSHLLKNDIASSTY